MSTAGIDLRTFTYIDILQPQLASFIQTISQGFLPLEQQAALYVEIAPGLQINSVTDVALTQTAVVPGMQIVERAFGLLEMHHEDQGQIRAAGSAILDYFGLTEEDRLQPRVVSREIITGMTDRQSAIINRMRHGDLLLKNQTLYILETHPAAYAAIACNEAEKASPISVLEVMTFGAFGRLYLGGGEDEIIEAAKAAEACLEALSGRSNPAP